MTSRRPATAGGSSATLGPESFAPAPGEMEGLDEGWGDVPKVPPATALPIIPPPIDSTDVPRAPIPTMDFEGGLDFRGELPTLVLESTHARREMPTVEVAPGAPPRDAYRSVPPRSSMPTVEHSDPLTFDVSPRASRPPAPPSGRHRAVPKPDYSAEMKARFAEADFSGALLFAEALLGEDPAHAEAILYANSCRQGLTEMYVEHFGSWASVLSLGVSSDMLRKMEISAMDWFVIACVDGSSTLAEIVRALGIPEHKALRILTDLLQRGILLR